MYKQLLLAILTALCCVTTSYGQTLKITDVNSNDDRMYKSASERGLGKNLKIEMFDKSVRVTLPGEKPAILQLVSDGVYHATLEKREHETMTADLTLDTVLGFIKGAAYTITIAEIGGQYRHANVTFTAKRF